MNVVLALCVLVMAIGAPLARAAEERPKTIVVLVDLSDSTVNARQDYISYFKMILNSMRGGDRVIVGYIAKDPSNGPILRLNTVLPVRNQLMDNADGYKRKVRKKLNGALDGFTTLVGEQSLETPIIDVLQETQRWYASFPAPRKILVFFSDMKEYSAKGLKFEGRKFSLSAQKAHAEVEKLGSTGHIADLAGVKVYVAGARDKDSSLVAQVQEFWRAYFEAAHADYEPVRYGSALLTFPECTDCSVLIK